MKYFWQGIAVILLSSLLICWIVCYSSDSKPAIFLAAVTGSILASVFVGSGFISFYLARTRKESSFHKIFAAGILGRLTVMIVVLALIFKYLDIAYLPFLISLMCCYFAYQIWEIISLNRLAAGGK
jgi:hypothetical protein